MKEGEEGGGRGKGAREANYRRGVNREQERKKKRRAGIPATLTNTGPGTDARPRLHDALKEPNG